MWSLFKTPWRPSKQPLQPLELFLYIHACCFVLVGQKLITECACGKINYYKKTETQPQIQCNIWIEWLNHITKAECTCCRDDLVCLSLCSWKPDKWMCHWTSRRRRSRSTFGKSRPSDKAFYQKPQTDWVSYVINWPITWLVNYQEIW